MKTSIGEIIYDVVGMDPIASDLGADMFEYQEIHEKYQKLCDWLDQNLPNHLEVVRRAVLGASEAHIAFLWEKGIKSRTEGIPFKERQILPQIRAGERFIQEVKNLKYHPARKWAQFSDVPLLKKDPDLFIRINLFRICQK
jgi:hypothetical protein